MAGTLALVALTLFVVESVWASTCAPGMDMEDVAMAVADEAPPPHDCMHGWNGHGDGDEDADDERPCPFGPVASAQACVGIASLPARAVAAFASPPVGSTSVFVELTEHDLLLEAVPFHPPRA